MKPKHLLLGAALGFSLSRIGFHDYDQLQRMFTFQDFRLLFTFMGAAGVLMALWPLAFPGEQVTRKPFHKGIIPGSVLFGVGWALTGGCPPVALLQLAEGRLPALATLAGVATGVFLFARFRKIPPL